MNLSFRIAGAGDIDDVALLIDALDRHYLGDAEAPGLPATRAMVEAAMAANEGTRFLIARADGAPAGIACFAILRPGHRLAGLIFLKDLYVTAEHRDRGVGRALMVELAAYARREGIGRIELTTEPRNPDAVRFYERLGAMKPEKIYFRFPPEALAALAHGADAPNG